MDACKVCGQPYHSETARAVAQRCSQCGRMTCPDCARVLVDGDGRGIGRGCRECMEAAATEVARIGVVLRYHPAYVGQRDAAGIPLRRADVEAGQVAFQW